jgi:xanthine dehydrogenase accessory factor
MQWLGEAVSRLERGVAVALVTVLRTRSSAPRPVGTRMVVADDGAVGSIGGGAFERRALARAQTLLADGAGGRREIATDLGETELLFERLDARDLPVLRTCRDLLAGDGAVLITPLDRPASARLALAWRDAGPALVEALAAGADAALLALPGEPPALVERLVDRRTAVWLFGAGHVGQALARALAPLPFHLTWIDDRPQLLPPADEGVRPLPTAEPAREVGNMPAGAFAVAMTYSHALDYAIVEAALRRGDLGFVGMIASAAKKARCLELCRAHGLGEAALARLTAPIGVPGIRGREPAVIAASVAAQFLQVAEARQAGRPAAAPMAAVAEAPGG